MRWASQLTEGEPAPKAVPSAYEHFQWPVDRKVSCKAIQQPSHVDFFSVLKARRSERELSPSSFSAIVNWLAFSIHPDFIVNSDSFQRSRSIVPSAGALHAVEPILVHRRFGLFRYDWQNHTIDHLVPRDNEAACAFCERVEALVPDAKGFLIAFVADAAKIEAVYDNGKSLLFRDAGALLAILNLTATAFGFGFCALGILGQEIAVAFDNSRLIGVGAAVVGRFPSESEKVPG